MTRQERDDIRAEYEKTFGIFCLTAADRFKVSARKMREELDKWRNEKATCDWIKQQ